MKYSMKGIMSRAWEIKRENAANHFGLCLQMAWQEAKRPSKSTFYGYAVEKCVGMSYNMIFKAWSNYGKNRIYITREGYSDSVGYIDLDTMKFVPKKYTCKDFAADAENFLSKYEVA